MALNDQRTISELGRISGEVYDNDPSGIKYFKDNPEEMLIETAFGITSYTVIDYADTPTNMQALLLQKTGTDKYVIAFRGTQEWQDWISNGLTGLANYNPQVSAGKNFVQDMMAIHNISADNITLTGHSLGGIITQAVGADLHIQGYAYNPYGANLLSSLSPSLLPFYLAMGQMLDIFGFGDKNDPWLKDNLLTISYQDGELLNGDILSNLATELSEFLAENDHLGGVLPIFGIENAEGIVGGHSMPTLNTALDNYNRILGKFDGPISSKVLSDIFRMSSVNNVLNSFAEIVGESTFGTNGELLDRFVNSTATGLSITLLENETAETLTNQTSEPAHLYSLLKLNPFVINGISYSHLNQHGELDAENYSNYYIEDRAAFLYLIMHRDTASPIGNDMQFYDKTLGVDAYAGNGTPDLTDHHYIFGNLEGELIEGNSKDDHLYGSSPKAFSPHRAVFPCRTGSRSLAA